MLVYYIFMLNFIKNVSVSLQFTLMLLVLFLYQLYQPHVVSWQVLNYFFKVLENFQNVGTIFSFQNCLEIPSKNHGTKHPFVNALIMTQPLLKYKENEDVLFFFFSVSFVSNIFFSPENFKFISKTGKFFLLMSPQLECRIGFHASLLWSFLTSLSIQFFWNCLWMRCLTTYSLSFLFYSHQNIQSHKFSSEDFINTQYFIITNLYIYFSLIVISFSPQLLPITVLSNINIIEIHAQLKKISQNENEKILKTVSAIHLFNLIYLKHYYFNTQPI